MRCTKACSKVLLGGSSVDRGSRNNSRNSSSRCLCNHHRQLFLYCGEPTMMEATNSSRKFWRCSIPAMAAKGNIQEVRQRHVRVKRRIYERCHLPTHDIKDVIQETNTLDETKKRSRIIQKSLPRTRLDEASKDWGQLQRRRALSRQDRQGSRLATFKQDWPRSNQCLVRM